MHYIPKATSMLNFFLRCFLTGYDRNLPGFPRYQVLGSDDTGEYSLKINNVSLSDDAVFECQVGPGLNNRPIRASARLNVMRKWFFYIHFGITSYVYVTHLVTLQSHRPRLRLPASTLAPE